MTQPGTVHIVDDDDAVRDSLLILLESYGIEAAGYPSARAFLNNLPRAGKNCLLLDIHMPEMGGIELMDRLNEMGVSIPTVAITGRGDSVLRDQALKRGARAFLGKPVDGAQLMRAVASALGGTSAFA